MISAKPTQVRAYAVALTTLTALAPVSILIVICCRLDGPSAAGAWSLTAVAALCCALGVALLGQLLAPMSRAISALDTLKRKLGLDERVCVEADDLQTLAADVEQLVRRFDVVRHRMLNQHPGTGLPTREPFLSALAVDMKASDAPSLLALIRFCDFDRIASFDRRAAEAALTALGERLRDAARPDLALAQVDRDCFAIWFGVSPPDEASAELRAITYVLEQEITPGEETLTPTIATSAALYPHDADAPDQLLSCALAALPKGDSGQPSALAFFSSSSTEAARRRFLIEQGLRQALGREEFALHFQPIVDVALGQAVGAEALIRWSHPELGPVSPSEFVPVLEQTGLIEDVGQWVLHAACREARSWRTRGLSGLRVAVNLSTQQFRRAGLAASVVRAIEHHRLTPEDLEVELTETAAMQDSSRTRQALEQLRALGVGVAIDDFGAGYSSLSYLKNLPFTKLKIDREFIAGAHLRADSRAICATLVALGQGLGIRVLAEGVEEHAEVETLVALGCTLFQGYYFARPMSGERFFDVVSDPDWLRTLVRPAAAPPADQRRRAYAIQPAGWRALVALCGAGLLLSACAAAVTPAPTGSLAAPALRGATVGLSPGERLNLAVELLKHDHKDQARIELQALTSAAPHDSAGARLLRELDEDPQAALGQQHFNYTVRAGDTFESLAERFLGDRLRFYLLARYNGVDTPADIAVGQILMIPGAPHRSAPPPSRSAAAPTPTPIAPPAVASDPGRAKLLRSAALESLDRGQVARSVKLLQQAALLDPASNLIKRDLAKARRLQDGVRR
jgi:Amt family ammonium transporter